MDRQTLNLKHSSAIEGLTVTYPLLSASPGVHITDAYIRVW